MRNAERGALLLEVMVALAILALIGAAAVQMTNAALRAAREMARREELLHRADRLLALYALASASELDQRIGARRVDSLVVTVQRPEPALYRLAVAAIDRPDAQLLVTVVFRRPVSP